MDFSKLTTADKVVVGSTIAFFIFMFFPWFGIDGLEDFGDPTANGFDVGFLWGMLPLIMAVAMSAHVLVTRFAEGAQLPEAPWSKLYLGLGIAVAALVVLKLLIGESISGFGFSEDLDRRIGLFLATLAAIGVGVGGFLKFQEGDGAAAGSSGPPTSF